MTYNEAVLVVEIVIIKFYKKFVIKLNYFKTIKQLFKKNEKKKKHINYFKFLKPFFIKNIQFQTACYEGKFAIVLEFSIVNIVTKRGVLSE